MDNLEKKLLARVTVNYLFLGQFETFRASLKNLRTASPDIAVGILHEIVQNLGHLEGISWSRSISSPSQLAWLALGELLELSESGLINQKDGLLWSLYQWLTHELEALFLLQQLIELLKIRPNLPLDYISEIKACSSETPQNDTPISRQEVQDEKSSNTSDGLLQADTARPSEADTILSEGISILNQIYDSWEAQLRSFISNAMANILQNKGPDFQGTEAFKTGSSMSDKQKEIFRQISVCEPQLFTALCWIIARQKERITTAPAGVSAKSDGNDEGQVEDQIMSGKGGFIDDGVFLKEVQDALLTVMKGKLDHVPVQDCVWHLRFLHTDFGDSESAYRDVIQKIVRKAITPEFVALEDKNGTALLRTYQEVLASGNTTLLSMVETALDSCLKEAGDLFRSAHEPSVAPPLRYLHECLKCWRGEESMVQESSLSEIEVMHYCMRQLCHYSRVSGSHMFDLVMDAALSAIKMHQYQKTVDVLSLFPRLQPLAAVMGWDLLAGDTTARRKMMELLWKTKLVEFTAYKKHSEELQSCCIDYLCDQLCYHLEVAYFVARINSGLDWTPSYALFHIRGNKNGAKLIEEKPADGFVANLVLERLAMHSPIRVLFDVVPDLKLKHARALIKMFPISSVIAECKRSAF